MSTKRTAGELGKAYLEALQAKNRDAIVALLADDFVLDMPCNVSGTNDLSDSWHGLDVVRSKFDDAFQTIDVITLIDQELTQGTDPDIAFVEGLGVMKMFNGNPYNNRYVFRFDARDGKLKRVREYLNPVTAAISFGIPLPQV
jgi:ketosteroid isomerase-like protein